MAAPESRGPLLEVRDLHVHYGQVHAVQGVTVEVRRGEVVALLGANGAGKSSVIRAIVGLAQASSGAVMLRDERVDGLRCDERVRRGIAYVPEGRRVFADMTVHDNLLMGAYVVHDRLALREAIDEVYELFPLLRERSKQVAGTLSGGEQQMLAIGRALVRRPDVLLLDEPSLGLAPVMVKVIYETLRKIRSTGTTLLLAEQSAHIALKVADRAYVLETGRVSFQGDAAGLRDDPALRESYLGV
jgi:branched-chain amino acid transport system ATP-binding protein